MRRTFDYHHTVTLEETNLVGNVYFTNYLRWQGHCREHFLMDRAPGVLRALRTDFALVTESCRCDFFAELYAADQVEVRMALGGMADNQVTMAFDYYRANGAVAQLVARGSQTVACMRRSDTGLVPVDVPDELREALAEYRA